MTKEKQGNRKGNFLGSEAAFYASLLRRSFPVAVVGRSMAECFEKATGHRSKFVEIPDQPGSRVFYERKVVEDQGFIPTVTDNKSSRLS